MIKRLVIYFKAIRGKELLLMLGSPLLGALFGLVNSKANPDIKFRLIVFLAATYALGAHIYAYNNWAGFHADRKDISKENFPLVAGEVTAREMLILSMILLAVSVLGYLFLDIKLAGLALLCAALWFLYCNHRVLWKTKPVLGSLVHLVTGVLNFLLGYLLVSELDIRGILIGLFFAIIFIAGHLNHELRDYEADMRNGFKTSAIVFGKRVVFIASVALFTYSNVHLLLLHLYYGFPLELAAASWVIFPVYLLFTVNTWKEHVNFSAMDKFRTRYRVLYAVYGFFVMVYLVRLLIVSKTLRF